MVVESDDRFLGFVFVSGLSASISTLDDRVVVARRERICEES